MGKINTKATVVLTTKNRRELLRTALRSVAGQDVDVEVIVVDDGSTDSTFDLVRADFPTVRLVRNDVSVGIISARNQALELATAPIAFILDDDAVFSAPDVVRKTLADFNRPEVGAVAIPHVNVWPDGRRDEINFIPWSAQEDFPCAASFTGCACALRVSDFRRVGGFSGKGRQNEETSFSLRLMALGRVVRIGRASPVHHYLQHGVQNEKENFGKTVENRLAATYESFPLAWLPFVLPFAVSTFMLNGARRGAFGATFHGIVRGLAQLPNLNRRPVPMKIIRLQRRLTKGPLPITQVMSKGNL